MNTFGVIFTENDIELHSTDDSGDSFIAYTLAPIPESVAMAHGDHNDPHQEEAIRFHMRTNGFNLHGLHTQNITATEIEYQ